MGKLTIEVWIKDRQEYVEKGSDLDKALLLDTDGELFIDTDNGLSFPASENLEAHFFIDGKRVG